MRHLVLSAVAVSILLVGGPPASAQPFTWDSFNPPEKKLDPANWLVGDQVTINGALGLELRREITGGKLVMSHRAVGTSGSGSGTSLNRLFFKNATPFTSLQADVRVSAVSTTDCPADFTGTTVAAEQFNRLFNTNTLDADTGGVCTSLSCDVYAIFIIEHSNTFNGDPTLFDIRARMEARVVDDSALVTIGDVPVGTNLKKGSTVTIKWVWHPADHKVTFSTNQKKTTPVDIDYGSTTTNPPAFTLNDIEIDIFPCNSSTAPGLGDLATTWDKIVVTQ